jgi:hypothetical protein
VQRHTAAAASAIEYVRGFGSRINFELLVLRSLPDTSDTGENGEQEHAAKAMSSDAGISVVRRNTEEVQGRGNFEVFEKLFAPDFVDHTPQPGGFTPDRDSARNLYRTLRSAFPDFHAEIH